jgi:hypothetical protein
MGALWWRRRPRQAEGAVERGKAGSQETRWREGWQAVALGSSTVEMLAIESPAAMEKAGVARQSTIAAARVRSSYGDIFLENGDIVLRFRTCV